MRSILVRLPGALLALVLACCGGSADPTLAGIGSGGTGGVAYGAITGFGSVIVNGVKFDDTGARVTIDGVPDRPVSELRLGMVAEVRGTIDPGGKTGHAQEIVASLALRGPVSVVGTAGVEVLGQQVRVDAGTVLDGISSLAALAPGDAVAVSGLRDAAAAAIVATRIERRAAADGSSVEVEGTVSGLGADTFRLDSLTVTYTGAHLVDVPATGLANGMLVRVESNQAPVGNAVVAASVRALSTTPPAGAFVEYVGYVSGYASVSSFRVGSLTVNASGAHFTGGTSTALANGVRVEVEGTVADGIVNATEVDFLALGTEPAAEVEGAITDFISASNFRVRGQLVDASRATFSGGVAANLANGRVVHAIGLVDGSVLAASSIEFRDTTPPELTRLAVDGTITDFASSLGFRVNGQPVSTSGLTVFTGGGAADLANGRHVAAEGVVQGGVLAAATVTIFPALAPQVVTTEGRVSGFVSPASFTVNGQAVSASSATTYLSGSAAQLANGVTVSVTGTISAGVLHATSIRFRSDDGGDSATEVEGYVSQFVSVANFKVAGQLVDATHAAFENGRASDLADGLKVQATGTIVSGVLRATKIEIDR